jgi:hypothetical protein
MVGWLPQNRGRFAPKNYPGLTAQEIGRAPGPYSTDAVYIAATGIPSSELPTLN